MAVIRLGSIFSVADYPWTSVIFLVIGIIFSSILALVFPYDGSRNLNVNLISEDLREGRVDRSGTQVEILSEFESFAESDDDETMDFEVRSGLAYYGITVNDGPLWFYHSLELPSFYSRIHESERTGDKL